MSHEEQQQLIEYIKSQVPPIGWSVAPWNIQGQPKEIRVAKHTLIAGFINPPIRHCWYIKNIDEWKAQYRFIREHFEEREYQEPIVSNEPEIRTHNPFTNVVECPLCTIKGKTTVATMQLIATRKHIEHKEIVNLSLMLYCKYCGIIERIGAFSDYEFTGFQGGITQTSVIKKDEK